jgi:oxygen-independent coproporphyrinogen-3 oxidase
MKAYAGALIAELEKNSDLLKDKKLASVYIGGGTPSLMDHRDIAGILKTIDSVTAICEDTEVSMEMNPGTVGMAEDGCPAEDKIKYLLDAGVNRISLGLQSANDNELRALGRIHSFDDLKRSYDLLRECGVAEINLDIMTSIPYQTKKSLQHTLDTLISLNPDHISAYSLIIEDGTPFGKTGADRLHLPNEDEAYELDCHTVSFLEDKGYERYEISNYAKREQDRDHRCRHNLRYWDRKDYLGVGVSAASLIGDHRYTNTPDINEYMKEPGKVRSEDRTLNEAEAMEEFMFLGLRKTEGVSKVDFRNEFGKSVEEVYAKVLEKYISEGLLIDTNGWIRLTGRGLDISNRILADFLF